MLPLEIAAGLLLAIEAIGVALLLGATYFWERKFMTPARRREVEARRSARHPATLVHRLWAAATPVIVIGLPTLLALDGLFLKIGLLYARPLSFLNPLDVPMQVAGVVLATVALVIMWVCARTLAEHVFSKAEGERTMLTEGVYAYIRHPLYLAFILITVGMVLLTLNYLSLLLIPGMLVFTDSDLRECGREGRFTFLPKAIECEERGLLRLYGRDYEEYMARTGRLLPRVRGAGRR